MILSKKKNLRHFNFNIFKILNRKQPDIVITSGFNITMLVAFFWTFLNKKKHIPFTDGTIDSEKKLTFLHKIVRVIVYKKSFSFLGASNKSIELYKKYGISKNKIFKSVLSIDNKKFNLRKIKKEYDLMFSGQFIQRKNPLFFLELFKILSEDNKNLKALMLGDGIMKNDLINYINKYSLNVHLPGYVQQDDLPLFYNKSKLFIFPTSNEPWGLVCNEAIASGVPVITNRLAGCSEEIVINDLNGYVLSDFDKKKWLKKIKFLLRNKNKVAEFSINGKSNLRKYNFKNSAIGIYNAAMLDIDK